MAARFQIQAFLLRSELRQGPSQFRLLKIIDYASQAGDAFPLTNAMDVEELMKATSRNLEAFTLKQ